MFQILRNALGVHAILASVLLPQLTAVAAPIPSAAVDDSCVELSFITSVPRFGKILSEQYCGIDGRAEYSFSVDPVGIVPQESNIDWSFLTARTDQSYPGFGEHCFRQAISETVRRGLNEEQSELLLGPLSIDIKRFQKGKISREKLERTFLLVISKRGENNCKE